jgi:hypothetical protein
MLLTARLAFGCELRHIVQWNHYRRIVMLDIRLIQNAYLKLQLKRVHCSSPGLRITHWFQDDRKTENIGWVLSQGKSNERVLIAVLDKHFG